MFLTIDQINAVYDHIEYNGSVKLTVFVDSSTRKTLTFYSLHQAISDLVNFPSTSYIKSIPNEKEVQINS